MNQKSNKQSILLVDDTLDNLRVLQQTLEPEGYDIMAVNSGEAGLKVANQAKPDLILLDVMMPRMDGFETLKKLQGETDIKSIPVIFITAKTEPVDVEQYFSAGAVDYIGKPFCQLEVCSRVRMHLALRGCISVSVVPSTSTLQKSVAAPQQPSVSANSFLVKIDDDILYDLAGTYLSELRKEMPVLEEAFHRKDFDAIGRMAHNYIGTGAGHGFKPLTYLGQALEHTAGQHQEVAVSALIESFKDYLTRVEVVS